MKDLAIVLDAMGVIYQAADDVAELLIPFVQEKGGTRDKDEVARQYTLASLGKITTGSFWTSVGLSPNVEDEYLSGHCLTPGLVEFLDRFPAASVWCLSNDVAEWSRKLRSRHNLEQRFAGFIISGDVGSRKPDRAIYQCLLDSSRRPANSMLFVDDRVKNLDSAQSLGFRTVLFAPTIDPPSGVPHRAISSFPDLALYLERQYNVRLRD